MGGGFIFWVTVLQPRKTTFEAVGVKPEVLQLKLQEKSLAFTMRVKLADCQH